MSLLQVFLNEIIALGNVTIAVSLRYHRQIFALILSKFDQTNQLFPPVRKPVFYDFKGNSSYIISIAVK